MSCLSFLLLWLYWTRFALLDRCSQRRGGSGRPLSQCLPVEQSSTLHLLCTVLNVIFQFQRKYDVNPFYVEEGRLLFTSLSLFCSGTVQWVAHPHLSWFGFIKETLDPWKTGRGKQWCPWISAAHFACNDIQIKHNIIVGPCKPITIFSHPCIWVRCMWKQFLFQNTVPVSLTGFSQ